MMYSPLLTALSRTLFYPLWDLYDRSDKLREWRRLEKSEREPIGIKRAEQLQKLIRITGEARAHVPFYRMRARERVTDFESLRSWPVITKDDIQREGKAFLSDLVPKAHLVEAKTGGSTGTSLHVFFDAPCQEKRNAAALYTNRWSGWEFGDAVGALWGNPPAAPFFKSWIRNALLDRLLFLDTVAMTDPAMGDFLSRIKKNRVEFLFGHAHSIFILANYIHLNGLERPPMRGIVSTSMMLLPTERKLIEDVFQCRVIDRYGCEEVGLIASQCERGDGFHINIDHLFVEFLRADGSPAQAGEDASLVVTDLSNRGMPLIRYAVGDRAVPSSRKCSCGRTWPLLERVTGRVADFLMKTDGSLVAGVSLVERTLTAIPGLAQMQIVQEKADLLIVNAVSANGETAAIEKALLIELRRVFENEISIEIRFLPALPQERNGKYRFAICKVASRYQGMAL